MYFHELPLCEEIQRVLRELHFDMMFPVQEQVIPLMLAKQDVIIRSATGSGKTAGYLLPIIQACKWEERLPQALVLVPTRELALQVQEEFAHLALYRRLKSVALFGKQPYKFQIQDLAQRTHVVIGTPGRVLDHLQRGTLCLEKLSMFVLDEADEMMRMGFIESLKQILTFLPKPHTTALCSATMPEAMQQLAASFLQAPRYVEASEHRKDSAEQILYNVAEVEKAEVLLQLLCQEQPNACLIFTNTQARTEQVYQQLCAYHISVGRLHGGMLQTVRIENMQAFRKGHIRILAATDVAARGIDVADVTHIINYDMPGKPEIYVHRMGRTARAYGLRGKMISLLTPQDMPQKQELERYMGMRLPLQAAPLPKPDKEAALTLLQSAPQPKPDKAAKLQEDIWTLYIGAGKAKKLRAGDVVGAICQIEGVSAADIGIIQIQDHHTYVQILNKKGTMVLAALQKQQIKGKQRKVMRAQKEA